MKCRSGTQQRLLVLARRPGASFVLSMTANDRGHQPANARAAAKRAGLLL